MQLMERIGKDIGGLMNALESDFKKTEVKFDLNKMFEVE